jgi:hypothetical protein
MPITIRPRPNAPPTAPPTIAPVSDFLLWDDSLVGVGVRVAEVVDDVEAEFADCALLINPIPTDDRANVCSATAPIPVAAYGTKD